eukprot:2965625-Pleurochrysis_carterae.AAC.1
MRPRIELRLFLDATQLPHPEATVSFKRSRLPCAPSRRSSPSCHAPRPSLSAVESLARPPPPSPPLAPGSRKRGASARLPVK